jgi:AraC-like DNA-binding protein
MDDVTKFNDIQNKNYRLMAEGHILEARYFYFETHPNYNRELAIVFGGYEKCAPDFDIQRRTYPYYILEYSLEGRCTLEINAVSHNLTSGIVAGFAPGNHHHYACDRSIPWEHFWLAFVGAKAKNLFEKSTLYAKGAIVGSPNTMQLMQAIITNGTQKTQHAQEICSSYLRILLLSLGESRNAMRPVASVATATYHNCQKYIDENFSSLISPSQVADACGINVRYMSRLFKKYNTVTPQEYIMRLKLNKAVNLLLTSGLAINEIGHSLGFSDPYHFSRVFKRFHGLAPHHYRQLHMI